MSGKVVALTFVVPKLNSPHKTLNRSRVTVPREGGWRRGKMHKKKQKKKKKKK